MRPKSNSLQKNYELHDVGEAHIRRKCEHAGLGVESWGIDMREDDETLTYDDKMDFKIWSLSGRGADSHRERDERLGIIEVKTKRSADWYGTINRRHWRKYVHWAHTLDVPCYVYMSLIDESADERDMVVRDTYIPVQQWDEAARVLDGEFSHYPPTAIEQFLIDQIDDHPQVTSTWRAPDGNRVVDLDVSTGVGWQAVLYDLYSPEWWWMFS